MSIKLMSQVWDLDISHERQLVLLALADHADDEGRNCYPSVARLAWKTNYSERGIQYILRRLEDDGLIVRHGDPRRGRYGHGQEYHLCLERGSRKGAFNGAKTAPPAHSNGAESSNEMVQNRTANGATAIAPESSVEPPGNNHHKERAQRTSLPNDWKPDGPLIDWAARELDLEHLDLIAETEKFKEHFAATGKLHKDWRAAWRLWMRRAPEFTKGGKR